MHHITIRDQVCNVMASLTKTFVSPEIVLQQLEAITACSSWAKARTGTTWSSRVLWTRWMLSQTDSQSHVSCMLMLSLSADRWEPYDTTASHCNAQNENRDPNGRQHLQTYWPWQATAQTAFGQQGQPVHLLVQGWKLLYSLLNLFSTHLWWPWWSPWCSSPGNS